MHHNKDKSSEARFSYLQLAVGPIKGSAAKERRQDNLTSDGQKREEHNATEQASIHDGKQASGLEPNREGRRKVQAWSGSKSKKTRSQEFMFKEIRKDPADSSILVDPNSDKLESAQAQLQLLFDDLAGDREGSAARQQSTIAKMQTDFNKIQHCEIDPRELDSAPSYSSARY